MQKICFNNNMNVSDRPSREEAKEAVKLLLRFIGDDPSREGLLKTPERVIKDYEEMFTGYNVDITDVVENALYKAEQFDDIVLLRAIRFISFCEHHVLPIVGFADIAYVPAEKIIGISKLARLVDVFAKRLQVQERMTVQIAESIQDVLNPRGVAVKITAIHSCIAIRGVSQHNAQLDSVRYTGLFIEQNRYRQEFLNLICNAKNDNL